MPARSGVAATPAQPSPCLQYPLPRAIHTLRENQAPYPLALDNVLNVHHYTCMKRSSAITVRLPDSLKRRLRSRAAAEHRSLSAQVVADLERIVGEAATPSTDEGRFLGLYSGTALPTDQDIADARRLLWGQLGHDG